MKAIDKETKISRNIAITVIYITINYSRLELIAIRTIK